MRGGKTASTKATVGTEYVRHVCGFCEAQAGAYVRHYEVLRCVCGRFFWALQPKRSGPLVLVAHPGFHRLEAA